MQELLSNPAVQGGAAPFAVALIAVFALFALRLGGLAIPPLGVATRTESAGRPEGANSL